MNYMLDKINLLDNKDAILDGADKIFELLMTDEKLDKSEKLMTIELAMAKLNYELYQISGDNSNKD